MKATLLLSVVCLSTALPALAQYGWMFQNPHPQGSDLNAVALLDASTAVAVGTFASSSAPRTAAPPGRRR